MRKEWEEKKRKEEEKKRKEEKDKSKIKNESTQATDLDSAITKFMNLVQANISRIHIRFEDDYFAFDSPYSFGILMDSLNLNTPTRDIEFDNPLDLEYWEIDPPNPNSLFLKHILIGGVAVYWTSKSTSLIPSAKLFDSEESRWWIFRELEPEQLRLKMLWPFAGSADVGRAFRSWSPNQIITPNDEY